MKSEKAIREKIKEKYDWVVEKTFPENMPNWFKQHQKEIDDLWHQTMEMGFNDALEWVLEGEPRYSVAELEKIWYAAHLGEVKIFTKDFLEFLKDKDKVQEALK